MLMDTQTIRSTMTDVSPRKTGAPVVLENLTDSSARPKRSTDSRSTSRRESS